MARAGRREDRGGTGPFSRPWRGFWLSFRIHCGLLGLVLLDTALDTVLTPPHGRPPSIGWAAELALRPPPVAVWISSVASPFLFLWSPAILLLAVGAGLRAAFAARTVPGRAFGAAFAVSGALVVAELFVPVKGGALNALEVARGFLVVAGLAVAPVVLLHPFLDRRGDRFVLPSVPALLAWSVLVMNIGVFMIPPGGDLWRLFPAAFRAGRYSTMVGQVYRDTLWIRAAVGSAFVLFPALVVLRGRRLAGALADLGRGWLRRPGLMLGATFLVLLGGLGLRIGWTVLEIAEMWGPRILLGVGIGMAAAWFGSFALFVASRAVARLSPAATERLDAAAKSVRAVRAGK